MTIRSFAERLDDICREHEIAPWRAIAPGHVQEKCGVSGHEGMVRIQLSDDTYLMLTPDHAFQFSQILASFAFGAKQNEMRILSESGR